MTITLSSKEFDEAVSLWLEDQGFSANSYDISTRVLVGRGDNPLGTRLEIQLDAKPRATTHYEAIAGVASMLDSLTVTSQLLPDFVDDSLVKSSTTFSQRASQGHIDEQ